VWLAKRFCCRGPLLLGGKSVQSGPYFLMYPMRAWFSHLASETILPNSVKLIFTMAAL
jgi:hypothetical protein